MLEWLKAILGDAYTEEIDRQVSAEIGKAFVSRADFNAANEAKKTAETQVRERDKQLEELKKVDAAGLQDQIKQLQEANKKAAEQAAAQIAAIRLDAGLDAAIVAAHGRNPKAIKALIDTSKLSIAEDGTLTGLDLTALKTSDPYLFDEVTTSIAGTGTPDAGQPSRTGDTPPDDYAAYVAWRKQNP